MKLCFPVAKNDGLDSQLFSHFGSAPLFLMVDTETQNVTELTNPKAQGGCGRHKAMAANKVDALVVAGIGRGALVNLQNEGIQVYKAQGATITDNILSLVSQRLDPLGNDQVCGGHQHKHGQRSGHGCQH